MTQQELNEKYCGKYVDQNRILRFHMMGKFGKCFVYDFSITTEDYLITVEINVDEGKVIGIVPEKELRDDGWGINPDAGPAELLPEEIDRIAMYMDSVMA